MNIQQFLEEEYQELVRHAFNSTGIIHDVEFIKKHDTRLINKVLDEVNNKVGELYRKYEGEPIIIVEHMMLDKISTIIDQLKLK